jgi:hypothetical protein
VDFPADFNCCEYLESDDKEETFGELDDDEIIKNIIEGDQEEEIKSENEEPEEIPKIMDKQGFQAAKTLQLFLMQHPNASKDLCDMARSLDSFIENQSMGTLKQSNITDLFKHV